MLALRRAVLGHRRRQCRGGYHPPTHLQASHKDDLWEALLQVLGPLAAHQLHQLVAHGLDEGHVGRDAHDDLRARHWLDQWWGMHACGWAWRAVGRVCCCAPLPMNTNMRGHWLHASPCKPRQLPHWSQALGTIRSPVPVAACGAPPSVPVRTRTHARTSPPSTPHHAHLLAQRLLLHALHEPPDHGQADIRLQQRPPDLLQRLLHVLRRQLAVLGHQLPGPLHGAAERVKHGCPDDQLALHTGAAGKRGRGRDSFLRVWSVRGWRACVPPPPPQRSPCSCCCCCCYA